MKNILEEIEKQLRVNQDELAEEKLNQTEESEIDWPDDFNTLHHEKWEELNYRIWQYHNFGKWTDYNQLEKEIMVNFPLSAMLYSGIWTITEITVEGNICYDFLDMMRARRNLLNKLYSCSSNYAPFSLYDGMMDLMDYFSYYKQDTHYELKDKDDPSIFKDVEHRIEPIFMINGHKLSWSDFLRDDDQCMFDGTFEEDIDYTEIDGYYSEDNSDELSFDRHLQEEYVNGLNEELQRLFEKKNDILKILSSPDIGSETLKNAELEDSYCNGRLYWIDRQLKYIR